MPHPFVRRASLLTVAACLAAACGDATNPGNGNNPGPGHVQTTAVDVIDNDFDPDDIRVSAGQTVTWTWRGNNQHNVTFDNVSVGNSATKSDGTFQRTFNDTGTFTYYCTIHGRAVMSGEVLVE